MGSQVEFDLIILNCALVTHVDIQECDIGIRDEKIKAVEPCGKLSGAISKRTIDAEGAHVTVNSVTPVLVRW